MKKQTKVVLTILCAVLLVFGAVFGTLAYFTDSASAQNTFTVGNIQIDLNESDVDADNDTKANSYHILPGQTYKKDPVVTVLKESEDCYIRMMVTVNYDALKLAFPKDNGFADYWMDNNLFLLQKLVPDWDGTVWVMNGATVDGANVTYEFRYKEVVEKADTDVKLPALFSELKIPGKLNNDQMKALDDFEVKIVAHAIQAVGFADADAAWLAFATQHS